MKDIRIIAGRIARKFDVEKIILFGSHANGMPFQRSDVDLLVVVKSNLRHSELRYRIYSELKDVSIPFDVVIREPNQVDTAKDRRDWFLLNILRHGLPVYGG